MNISLLGSSTVTCILVKLINALFVYSSGLLMKYLRIHQMKKQKMLAIFFIQHFARLFI